MSRIAVIGNAAGGKSTLCRKLALVKQLPLYAVDRFQWNPGWKRKPEKETRKGLDALLDSEKWIIDGWGPWDCISRRLTEADTIIFIDYPLWIHLLWATKRQISAFLLPRNIEKPIGCDLRAITPRMFRMILHIDKAFIPRLRTLVEAQQDNTDVYHITSPKCLAEFVETHC